MPELNRRGGHRRPADPRGRTGGARTRPATARGVPARLEGLGTVVVGGAGAALCIVVLLVGLALGASRVAVPTGEWGAAAGLALIVAGGLLYAFRLRASGPR